MSSARDIMLSAQEEAKGLIAELLVLEKAGINGDSIDWPAIDYGQVSTETCQELFNLVEKTVEVRGPAEPVLETPRQVQIARQLDAVLIERQYLAKKRVLMAQTLDEQIRRDLVPITDFLRVARRNNSEHFAFPHHKKKLLESLASMEEALYQVADMVRGEDDMDETEPDTEAGDATQLEYRYKIEAQ
ncbi:hypothetical protein K438DRAFT_1777963 [Mycena galopus ATCC 62051]